MILPNWIQYKEIYVNRIGIYHLYLEFRGCWILEIWEGKRDFNSKLLERHYMDSTNIKSLQRASVDCLFELLKEIR